jgi:opacity protein-like surface antigen
MQWKHIIRVRLILTALALSMASTALAQGAAPERRWSADIGIGFDNSISGNINSSGIGTLNGQTTVILKNKYEDVYGTGLHLRFGGGYMFKENVEARVTFTFQSLDADLVPMGDIGISNLYGQYADYQAFGIDFGLRQYMPIKNSIRGYGEATIGVAVIDELDITFAAPTANISGLASDFYDRTAAFTFGINGGVLFGIKPQFDVFAQIGLRYVTGLAEIDQFASTGLNTINDKSARWSIPIAAGVRFRF